MPYPVRSADIELAIETGLRRGDLLGLLWHHVDLQCRLLFDP
jgi:integrase